MKLLDKIFILDDKLNECLIVKNKKRNVFQIILWWEKRRILYNIIVFIAGTSSVIILTLIASPQVELEAGEDLFEPLLIFLFAILCNIFYTLGWLTEIFIKRSVTYAPKMFKLGLWFTLFWVFMPTTMWIISTIVNLIKKIFV
ncbi:MAG: hypothetical protein LBT56_06680 [Prevotellaceae bacterium]|jgi:hypothetical protein|nr:hypothetical protein [Prevotellaceae bacterium]